MWDLSGVDDGFKEPLQWTSEKRAIQSEEFMGNAIEITRFPQRQSIENASDVRFGDREWRVGEHSIGWMKADWYRVHRGRVRCPGREKMGLRLWGMSDSTW
jgi:hypothetical protein